MATAIQTDKLLTVEEYARRPENGKREELVRGRIVELNVPYQRHGEIIAKAMEYLGAGAKCVCVLDEQTHTAHLYTEDAPERVVSADEELTFPDILTGFAAKVERFFE